MDAEVKKLKNKKRLKKLSKALHRIQKECERRVNCNGCPFLLGNGNCGFETSLIPCEWSLAKPTDENTELFE